MTWKMKLRCRSAVAGLALAAALPHAAAAQSPSPSSGDPCAAATPFAVAAGTAGTISLRAPHALLRLVIADTEPKRERGLMCVPAVAHAEGMIFAFPGDADSSRSFWMKNTLVSLDMVFVARDGRVTSVAARVPSTTVTTPDDAIPTRRGTGRYVIELAAGDAARDGIVTGTRLHIGAIPGS